jgi:hypothetical protein
MQMKVNGAPAFGQRLVAECREALSIVLPYTKEESKFLDLLLDDGVIKPWPLTSDVGLREKFSNQPLLS